MQDKTELLQQLQIDRSVPTEPKGISTLQLVLLLAVAIALSVLLTYWLVAPSTPVTSKPSTPPPITAEKPTSTASSSVPDSDAVLNASGYITARRTATVSAQIMGLITEVDVEEGMAVKQGQVLARLDNAIASSDFAYAKAQVASLRAHRQSILANLDEARRQLTRVQQNSYSSQAELTQAQTNVASLNANLTSADADIRVAEAAVARQQENLDNHIIRAPFDGVVTEKNAQPGEIVSPSSAGGGFTRTGICTIVDMTSLEIEVDVNEAFIGRVKPGQGVEGHLDAYPNWQIPGTVVAIIPTADRAKATVRVRIKLDVQDPRILPEMGVKVAFLKV